VEVDTVSQEVDVVLVGFSRALRAAGLAVSQDRAATFVTAVDLVGADRAQEVYWAGRATLCSQPDDLPVYDQVFQAWFSGRVPRPGRPRGPAPAVQRTAAPLTEGASPQGVQQDPEVVRALASETEVLRHRDLAELTASDKARLDALFTGLSVRLPRRASARRASARSGEVDARALLREQLRRGGEVGPMRYRRRVSRARPVVLLVDVSGSMNAYADALLRLGHLLVRTAGTSRVEVFSMGTRLTRLTPALSRSRAAPAALAAAGEVVPDWSGGTRLGEVLAAFVQRWGRRGIARGAVVVICSDGWERGDATLLAEQVRQLSLLAHRVVWANPHRGKDGYQPVQAGIVAVLPHLDDFVAGHSMAAFAELLDVIANS